MEDTEIIREVLAGHHEKFADLVERYQVPLIHFLRRTLSSDEDVFDCAQDAFLVVYRNLNRYSEEHPFRAWLYTIARNKAIDLGRKRRREVPLNYDENLVDQQPLPEDVWLAKEQTFMLAEVLKELPDHYGQAIYLRYRQELSYEEIALILEVPVSRVKTYLHRGKIRLREHLKRRGIHERDGQGVVDSTVTR